MCINGMLFGRPMDTSLRKQYLSANGRCPLSICIFGRDTRLIPSLSKGNDKWTHFSSSAMMARSLNKKDSYSWVLNQVNIGSYRDFLVSNLHFILLLRE
ncbi:hypothetical protein Naga_100005g45 [Nannochloropsis gaditana]|uniref:Uncharacterized protein n=1 Tax=Nannochloropsis gaditana TaxID=72520 RepID=W7TPD0_9STRA|nr:hypothetical protein Naga_100005g45 [Nannochloropsis gaditana]